MTSFPSLPATTLPQGRDVGYVRHVRRLRMLVLGLDLIALALGIALALAAHVAVGGAPLTAEQSNLAPLVVVALWLGAISALGGYRCAGTVRGELLVIVVASHLSATATWVAWHVTNFPLTVLIWSSLVASCTLTLLAARLGATRLLRLLGYPT